MKDEPIIQRSPRGKDVLKVLEELEAMQSNEEVTYVATSLISRIYSCMVAGDQYKLPSAAHGQMLSSFHKLRNSIAIDEVWHTLHIRETESQLCLQLIMPRFLELLIANRVKAQRTETTAKTYSLNQREKNAVRYMAGYIAVSLLKRYKKPSKNVHLQLKRDLFIRVLKKRRADQQPAGVTTVEDYTRMWSELIDR